MGPAQSAENFKLSFRILQCAASKGSTPPSPCHAALLGLSSKCPTSLVLPWTSQQVFTYARGLRCPPIGRVGTLMVQTPIQAAGSAEWAERRMSRQAVHPHTTFQSTGSSARCSLTALLLPPLWFCLPPPAGTLGACMCPTASSGCARPPTPATAHLMPIRQTPMNKHDTCALDAVRLPKQCTAWL